MDGARIAWIAWIALIAKGILGIYGWDTLSLLSCSLLPSWLELLFLYSVFMTSFTSLKCLNEIMIMPDIEKPDAVLS